VIGNFQLLALLVTDTDLRTVLLQEMGRQYNSNTLGVN
jgi:hypothetical protein